MENKASLLTGFLFGSLIGAAIALIIAQPRRDCDGEMGDSRHNMLWHSAETTRPVNTRKTETSCSAYDTQRMMLDEKQGVSSLPLT